MNTKIKSAAMMLAAVAAVIAVVGSIGTVGARDHVPPLGIAFHFVGASDSCSDAAAGVVKAGNGERETEGLVSITSQSEYAMSEAAYRALRISEYGFDALQESIPRFTGNVGKVCIFRVIAA